MEKSTCGFSTSVNKKVILSTLFLLCIGLPELTAQNAIPSSGGNATGTGGTVSYSIGQIVFSTIPGINGTITQGVQQPYEISVVTGIKEDKDISLEFSLFPNPAEEFIKLKIKNFEIDNLRYELYDVRANLLENRKIENNETTISMQYNLSGIYFLKIVKTQQSSAQKVIKTFKIIKK